MGGERFDWLARGTGGAGAYRLVIGMGPGLGGHQGAQLGIGHIQSIALRFTEHSSCFNEANGSGWQFKFTLEGPSVLKATMRTGTPKQMTES